MSKYIFAFLMVCLSGCVKQEVDSEEYIALHSEEWKCTETYQELRYCGKACYTYVTVCSEYKMRK